MSNDIQRINDLPSIDEVAKRSQALALLDAIIMPEWDFRYFSFNRRWTEDGSEMMASMRDGSGGEYFLHFSDRGVVGKVLDESPDEQCLLFLKDVPGSFASFKNETAFQVNDASFYFWRRKEDPEWMAVPSNLSSYSSLGFLKGGSAYYHEWAEGYYEKSIDENTVQEVFDSLTVTQEQLTILNPELTIEDISKDLEEIFGS